MKALKSFAGSVVALGVVVGAPLYLVYRLVKHSQRDRKEEEKTL